MLVIAFSHHVSVVSVVSGDWLLALPNANCGLRLDDEAVRPAVCMRLGLSLSVPHNCYCGTLVDAQGLPWSARRHRAKSQDTMFSMTSFGEPSVRAAGILAVKEPSGLDRQDGKRPAGANLNPVARWTFVGLGRSHVTVVSPLAASYVDRAAMHRRRYSGRYGRLTATRKTEK